ncbi:MAG: SRPBCC domain-containing protein [Anaerolineales bacterium]|uniref:SRPBCC family protein n=1 Tax=Promineifilum sp. TaxID=2664178 RepID=UPI001DB51A16|nr:SRPBCC domain-containing protein [Anaerolineales bacterium]MCO5181188.1 SRPBCC domain-containing protein [Promineifilum sp.]
MTQEITISRIIDASRERVFDAWTNPTALAQWWGPQGFTTTTQSADMRPGGVWQFVMHSPDGVDYPNRITFEEIARPERITYLHGEDEGKPRDFHTTVTFDDLGGRTRLTMHMVFATEALYQEALGFGAVEGGHSTLDSLTEFVAEGRPLVITRLLDAPVDRVWRALTEPEQVKRWWGPEHFTSPAAEIDLRVGGKYLFAMRDPEGKDYWTTGTYREIVPRKRLVYTDSFADAEGNVISPVDYGMSEDFPLAATVVIELEEQDGRTRLTTTHSGMPRDEMFEYARSGWSTSLDKLAATLTN